MWNQETKKRRACKGWNLNWYDSADQFWVPLKWNISVVGWDEFLENWEKPTLWTICIGIDNNTEIVYKKTKDTLLSKKTFYCGLGLRIDRVIRWIFESRWDEMTRSWRKLQNEELHNLYSSSGGAGCIAVVKALCNNQEGSGFDNRWNTFLNLTNPSGRIRPWSLLSL
jgi:hypothetical protein